MKQTFLKITFLFVALLAITTTVIYAVSNASGRACTLISTERGGFESEGDRAMQNAKNTYDSMGYTTNMLKNPGALTILSNALSSQVQLYCCHGNTEYLEFPNGGLHLGGYKEDGGKKFYDVESIDWSDKKLVTLSACNTAGNGSSSSSSIAAKIVSFGAQMSIGWYTEVNPFSMPDWLDHFHAEMDNGYDPLGAVNRANNEYWYFNNNVKNTLFSYRSISTLSNENLSKIILSDNNILNKVELKKLTETQIEDKIKESNPNFSVDNYEKKYSDGLYTLNVTTNDLRHVCSYIDYTLKIGDYLANSGYTVVLDNNGFVQQIIDHTKNLSNNHLLSNNNDTYIVSENDRAYYLNEAKKNITISSTIIDEDVEFYYDLNTNNKFATVTLKVTDNLLGSKIYSYTFDVTNNIY